MDLECFKDSPENSTELNSLKEASGAEKKRYLRELATSVVDKYVAQKRKVQDFFTKVLSLEELEKIQSIDQPKTDNGRFLCRFPGCTKSFAFNGKRKREHESQRDPPVIHDEICVTSSAPIQQQCSVTSETDDMYSYQCSFLEYSMIIENFFDAIREGDGERILRCFQLPYFTIIIFTIIPPRRPSAYLEQNNILKIWQWQ